MPIDQRLKDAVRQYLNRDATVEAMIRASDDGKPAVSAIGDDLLRRFGSEVTPNRVRKWIGKAVKAVMEVNGYEHHKKGEPANSLLFTEGSVYRRQSSTNTSRTQRMALDRIRIRGFKSIRKLSLKLRPVNVLIGANGSGKSNFLEVFPLTHAVRLGQVGRYSAMRGGADRALHFGSSTTPEIRIELRLSGGVDYAAALARTDEDRLLTVEESLSRKKGGEMDLLFPVEEKEEVEWALDRIMARWNAYQFHDTSSRSPMRGTALVRDRRRLRANGANLAPFLYRLKRRHRTSYRRILHTVRLAAPFLSDFVLEPDEDDQDSIRLEWLHAESEDFFDVASMSDGTLRFIALTTLFCQPVAFRPRVIVVDEPELGLHPAAITLLAEMIETAAHDSTVIVATQSPTLVDYFEPEDVVVVDLVDGATKFTRLENKELVKWLDDFSLGELWEKNHFGGRPA